MARCETCGNDYDKAFEIILAGESHYLTALNVQFTYWRQSARIAVVR
jgi:hypothetical protein